MLQSQSEIGRVSLDYNSVGIGENCLTLAWNYDGQNCIGTAFILQGFDLNQISSDQLETPRWTSSSASGIFTLIASSVLSLYFRVSATDRNGILCNAAPQFYYFAMLAETGMKKINVTIIILAISPIYSN